MKEFFNQANDFLKNFSTQFFKSERYVFLFLVLCGLLTSLSFFGQDTPDSDNWRISSDVWSGKTSLDDVYPEDSPPVRLKGKLYRPIVPFLAGIIPFSSSLSFALINLVSLLFIGILIYKIIFLATENKRVSVIAPILYYSSKGITIWGTAVIIDSFCHLVLLSGILLFYKWKSNYNLNKIIVSSVFLVFAFLTNTYMIQLGLFLLIMELTSFFQLKNNNIFQFIKSKEFFHICIIGIVSFSLYSIFWILTDIRLFFDVIQYALGMSSEDTIRGISIFNSPNPLIFIPILKDSLVWNFEFIIWFVPLGFLKVFSDIKEESMHNKLSLILAISLVLWFNPLLRASDLHTVFVSFPIFLLFGASGIIKFTDDFQQIISSYLSLPLQKALSFLVLVIIFSLFILISNSNILPLILALFWLCIYVIISILIVYQHESSIMDGGNLSY